MPRELRLVAQRDLDLVGKGSLEPRALARKGEEIGLAHIEVEMDRIERDQRCEQRRRARPGAVSGDQVADRDEMRADAPREGGRDAAVIEVELGVADLRLRVLHGRLRGAPLGQALIDALGRSGRFRNEVLGTVELAIGKCKSRARGLELRIRLRQPDLVGAPVDREEEIVLLDDVAVLEVYSRQRAADLGAQLDLIDGGELTEEAQPRADLAH